MQTNIYIDTNIVIDICDSARKLHENNFTTIARYMQEGCEFFISSDTLANLFYILSNRSTLASDEVLEKMYFVSEIFTLVPITSEDVVAALDLCKTHTAPYTDYEDALRYVCAKKIQADMIMTNDKQFVSLDIALCRTSEHT